MTVTRCASSQLISGLLAWRNPQGVEENWLSRRQGVENGWKHLGKVLCAEVGLGLLVITAVVETVAYSVLAIASLTIYAVNDKPFKFFVKLLESSSFTVIWGLFDAIIYNPFVLNVMTHESFARFSAGYFNPTLLTLYRLNDRLHITDWQQQHRSRNVLVPTLDPIFRAGRYTQELIDNGASFIQKDVLANATAETITLFRDMDASIYMFILTKAVYIYTAGANKIEAIPNFFKPESKNLIYALRHEIALRKEIISEETAVEIQRLLGNPTEFTTDPKSESANSFLSRLRTIAFGEYQKSLLTTRCWQKAIEQIVTE